MLRTLKNRCCPSNPSRLLAQNLQAWPITAGIVTSAVVGAAGDASAQQLNGVARLDRTRCLSMSGFCALYNGVIYAMMFRWYENVFTTTRLRCGPRGVLAAKVLFDNFIHTPLLYFPVYYTSMGAFKGQSMDEVWERAKQTWVSNNIVSCILWIPATVLVFSCVPLHLRVHFNNVVSLCWNTGLSLLSGSSLGGPIESDEEAGEPLMEDEGDELLTEDKATAPSSHHTEMDRSCAESRESEKVVAPPVIGICAVYAEGLEESGARLDAFMQRRLEDGEQWEKLQQYRTEYQAFRRGEPHGCRGELLEPEPRCDLTEDRGERQKLQQYRTEYQAFRRGEPHGCRGELLEPEPSCDIWQLHHGFQSGLLHECDTTQFGVACA